LKPLGLDTLDAVVAALAGLWNYSTTDWLRLTLPNRDDATRSRWPIHPLWALLAKVDWDGDAAVLSRLFTSDRAPSVLWILRQVLALLFSFMAVRGLYNYSRGIDQLKTELDAFLGERSVRDLVEPSRLVHEQVALKARRFNTAFNQDEIPDEDRLQEEHDELMRQADAYRKASRGS
jgi:hypothetical protein